jgi:hypothetical protein
MKLRLQGNSLRLRLTRSEVDRLRDAGSVSEVVDFGAAALRYRLESRPDDGPLQAELDHGVMTVSVSTDTARAWAGSNDVGIYGQSGALAVSIEKDFRCLTRPLDRDERDAYPHPGESLEPRP